MDHYAGIDVSLKESSVCMVDAKGKVVREVKVASEPEALVRYFGELELPVSRVGLEAGPLSQWLHAGLVAARFEVVLLETRHVKAALSAMTVKTDRKDARGIAQLLRMGWYHPVHVKSVDAQDSRALLVARKLLQSKLLDVELSIRGILRGDGLKVGEISRGRFEARIRELIAGHATLSMVIDAMLTARAALWSEFTKLHREMLRIARADRVCQRLMSAPGVGILVALTYRSAVDDPVRFGKSSTVGVYFGLTPKKYQSGETDRDGGVSKVGDAMVRTALFEAAHIMLTRATRFGFAGRERETSSLDALISLIDWSPVAVLLDPLYPASKGEPAWPPLAMFKALLLSIWYDLSDVKLAEAPGDRASFRRFCGFSVREAILDRQRALAGEAIG